MHHWWGRAFLGGCSQALPHSTCTLTLLLLLPAVVAEVGDIIILHVPFNGFEAGACVFLREGVGHIVEDRLYGRSGVESSTRGLKQT